MLGNLIFIFLLTVIAFGHAYFILFGTNDGGNTLVNMPTALGYAFVNAFGGNNISLFSNYETWISWLFFMISDLIIYIVLLNLLISIVGLVFGASQGNHNIIMYKDML